MPARVVQIRRDICTRAKCDAEPAFHDPCAECSNGHWRAYVRRGCDDPERESPAVIQAILTATAKKSIARKIEPQTWPLALLPLKLLAKEGDRGAGDIIARTIGPIGGDAFKVWYKRLFGKSCGCGARVDGLNARYPL